MVKVTYVLDDDYISITARCYDCRPGGHVWAAMRITPELFEESRPEVARRLRDVLHVYGCECLVPEVWEEETHAILSEGR